MRDHDRPSELTQDGPAADGGTGKSPRTARIQRKAGGGAGGDVSAAVAGLAGASGAALPDGTRQQFEGSLGNMSKITPTPKPGDVGYFEKNQHHCIISAVEGDRIETIDGNSFDGDSGGSGAITSKWRSRADFAGFFKNVDD